MEHYRLILVVFDAIFGSEDRGERPIRALAYIGDGIV